VKRKKKHVPFKQDYLCLLVNFYQPVKYGVINPGSQDDLGASSISELLLLLDDVLVKLHTFLKSE
jgi:hypothetical protein